MLGIFLGALHRIHPAKKPRDFSFQPGDKIAPPLILTDRCLEAAALSLVSSTLLSIYQPPVFKAQFAIPRHCGRVLSDSLWESDRWITIGFGTGSGVSMS